MVFRATLLTCNLDGESACSICMSDGKTSSEKRWNHGVLDLFQVSEGDEGQFVM